MVRLIVVIKYLLIHEPRALRRSNSYDNVPMPDVRGPRLHRDHLDRLVDDRSSCSSPSTHIRGTLRTGSGRHSSLVFVWESLSVPPACRNNPGGPFFG